MATCVRQCQRLPALATGPGGLQNFRGNPRTALPIHVPARSCSGEEAWRAHSALTDRAADGGLAVVRAARGTRCPDEGLAPVAYPLMPPVSADCPLPRKDQKVARGLRLYETFVAG